ncbi:ecto-ADP-ribosyltransferase 5-like [Lampris incognitus]|uniref:ecto-ADP-ribosyltransferase 5-like n=1 Tax=Lampris incognitus TaxID=2546036 RepID=UPI0024B5C491|nr:ecto-ADP-ribosyltransferase 5-like [Lampris incognitus]
MAVFLVNLTAASVLQIRKNDTLPLDMAPDSIDDMYDGCRSESAAMVDQLGVLEWHRNINFSLAWAGAQEKAKKPVHGHLGWDHATAIHIMTDTNLHTVRQDFKTAVQTGKRKYKTSGFRYHYLYFQLTDALRVLRQNQTLCRTTYLRKGKYFDLGVVDKTMRLGAFTLSTSSKHLVGLLGGVSCFEICTCFGAEITYYSATDQDRQVLIPPYEVFRVTDVLLETQGCKVLYKLQSTETPRSDLNCKLTTSRLKAYFIAVSGQEKGTGFVIVSMCLLILLALSSLILTKRRQKRFVAVVLGTLLVFMVIVVSRRTWRWLNQG